MSTNFATTVTDPAYERDEYEDDSAFREQDKPVRPNSEQLIGACIALGHARLKYLKDAEEARKIRPDHAEFWLKRAADTLVALEWLERGAP